MRDRIAGDTLIPKKRVVIWDISTDQCRATAHYTKATAFGTTLNVSMKRPCVNAMLRSSTFTSWQTRFSDHAKTVSTSNQCTLVTAGRTTPDEC